MLLLKLAMLLPLLSNSHARPAALNLSFTNTKSEPSWTSVNDGVMGGLSQGGAEMKDGILHFKGTLSLENNGGFSSIRTRNFSVDLSSAESISLRVLGDGRTYDLRLATNARYRGSRISYGAKFETKDGVWTEVSVPLASLKPSWRGRKLDGPPFDSSKIEEIGILLGDKKSGPFQLQIDWLKAE